MGRDIVQLVTAVSTISQEYLLEFTSEYGISKALHPELPGPEDRIVDFPEGKARPRVDVFQQEAWEKYLAMLHQALRLSKKLEQPLLLDMDLFNLFRAPNPTKVKTGSRLRAAHEVPLLIVTANRVIEIEYSAAATDSSGVPSIIERSSLDFANETAPENQETAAPEVPPPEDVPTIGDAPEAGPAKRVAAADPHVVKERHKRGHDRVDTNAPPKLGIGSTRPTPAPQSAPADVSDPDPLSFADPRSRPSADVAQSSNGAAVAGDLESENTSFASMVAMGSQLRLWFEQEAKLLKKSVAQVSSLQEQVSGEEKLKAAFEEFKQYEDNRVEQRCVEMDARLDALSIDFDEELYPHMLTAIAGRRWMIRHGLCLAVMKCDEFIELRQAFADVVSAGIAKGMSEGLKHGVEHGQAQLDLEAVEAYDLEAEAKYIAALQVLKNLKYPLVDQLKGLKDAPMDVIMAFLHLESDTGDDASPRTPSQFFPAHDPCVPVAIQTDTSDEASQLLRSSSLPVMHS
nr:transposase (putative), gypsy type [Tanacetum cinerariifolium]